MTPRPRRPGYAKGLWLAFLASVALLAGLIGLLAWDPSRWFATAPPTEPLIVYCAAALKTPVEAVARAYEKEYGVPVQLQFGGSETLLTNLAVSKRGDLFLPADDSYLQSARVRELAAESIPLATMTPVLAVRAGNPRGIHSIDDLLRDEVRLAQANPDAAAVGKLARAALQKSGHWDKLQRQTVVNQPTVIDVANAVKVGTVDAGIVWDVTVRQYPELEAVPLAPLAGVEARVAVGVLTCSKQPTAALRFARYLAARDRGLPEFERNGFRVVEGDAWAAEPELRLLAGAMLRPAIDETVTAFERREGVRVVRVYNGCGILVAQMRAGEHPDAYFACDKSFMSQVSDLFLDGVDVSTNQLVILVPKGNPHGIRTLDDLARPGLRVGVGHEKQCALGVITQQTLVQTGSRAAVMKNVVTQLPTGDMLVNNLRARSLDAVIAYVSNATSAPDELEAISIDVPCAVAVQPVAVGRESRYRQLTSRLLEAIRSRASRERFEANGFHWRDGTVPEGSR
jgi:molybdate transport system substrate-binding protein